ncbi:MAG: phenylalanine--tRNA ligase subunit beta [Alphaproteobacteria bacterium]
MKLTLSWLKDHLETTASIDEIANALTNLGLEVEGIDDPAKSLEGFVVARVVSCARHPNADRLSLCQVDDGSGGLVQVVCGAPNVRADMMVAFARVGQVIPVTGLPLKKGRIRDVDSCGMLCSARELHLGEDSDGILDLKTEASPGTSLSASLKFIDPVIELAITPNRGDCFGIRGIARDLAAAGLGILKAWPYKQQSVQGQSSVSATIQDTQGCPYFVGRYIRGLRNCPSPDWVQERLNAVGLRPISAIVDVSNYLSQDLGRPLHMFDAAKIQGDIVVRTAKAGETLDALNEKTYTLPEGAIVIADSKQALALGGIMGGVSSSCTDDTTDIFIECALFDPIRIAKTGRALNLHSDARTRFERGVDQAAVIAGIEAATDLVIQWCGGGVASELVIAGAEPDWQREITLSQSKLASLSGCDIALAEASEYLSKLGFASVNSTPAEIRVKVPSWRPDVEGAADLIEEVLRIKGYDAIPTVPLTTPAVLMNEVDATGAIKRLLAARGLSEVVTWSFISESLARLFGATGDTLLLDNPINQELAFMRPSLLPTLLLATARNQARGVNSGAFFEFGPQYKDDLSQRTLISGIRFGNIDSIRSVDAFDAKADCMAVLDWFGAGCQIETRAPDYYHPVRSATLCQGPKILAYFGELHPQVLATMDVRGPVVAFEVFVEAIGLPKRAKAALVISPYQAVERDFAFVVDKTIPADQLVKAIEKVDKQLIETVFVFDVYDGENIPSGKKSLALQVRLQPKQSTLTDAEIVSICEKIVEAVAKSTGGVLRT